MRVPDEPQAARALQVLFGQTLIVEALGRTAQVRVLGLAAPPLATADRPASCYSGGRSPAPGGFWTASR
jgi:hypothetical protein